MRPTVFFKDVHVMLYCRHKACCVSETNNHYHRYFCRSSLAFAQEVQDSKQMEDLMGKVTNLFSSNNHVSKGKIQLATLVVVVTKVKGPIILLLCNCTRP